MAEYPVLAAIRLDLEEQGRPPQTLDDQDRPTPFTLEGVERVVFHFIAPGDEAPIVAARERIAVLAGRLDDDPLRWCEAMENAGFWWGVSDGN